MKRQTAEYRNYIGEYEYFEEDKAYHGYVVGIKEIVHFTGKTIEEIEMEFTYSVDDYLDWCKVDRVSPKNLPLRLLRSYNINSLCFLSIFPNFPFGKT